MLLTTQNNDLIIAPLHQYKGMDAIPHPQFLIDSQLTNMSSQEVTMEKISCPPKQKEIL